MLVYNYKYSVELELAQELKNVTVSSKLGFRFFEETLHNKAVQVRKELTLIPAAFGDFKERDCYREPVHESTQKLEKFFDELDECVTNGILKTSRFCIGFWQDGSFWYLYNPYRCDKYGFYNDSGYACIVKFCSKDSLRRHLVTLIIRAYAFEIVPKKIPTEHKFDVQIYNVIFHSCDIHNVKLYTRALRKPRVPMIKVARDPCTFDPMAHLSKPCEVAREFSTLDDVRIAR